MVVVGSFVQLSVGLLFSLDCWLLPLISQLAVVLRYRDGRLFGFGKRAVLSLTA